MFLQHKLKIHGDRKLILDDQNSLLQETSLQPEREAVPSGMTISPSKPVAA
jgi:hypothetical protein